MSEEVPIMIKQVNGDLLELFEQNIFDGIVHGCNCFHTMGAGIARLIAQKFPQALAADKESKYGCREKLGEYTIADTQYGKIVNAYTQHGYTGNRPVKYDAIADAFAALNDEYQQEHFGIPCIGAGLAGGNWPAIFHIIDSVTPYIDITVVYYDLPMVKV